MKSYGQTLPGGSLQQSKAWTAATLPKSDQPIPRRPVTPKPASRRVEETPMPTPQRDAAIRAEYAEGAQRWELARKYRLARSSIHRILKAGEATR